MEQNSRKLKFDRRILVTVTHSFTDVSRSGQILSALLVCLTDDRLEYTRSINAVMMHFTIMEDVGRKRHVLFRVNKMNIVEHCGDIVLVFVSPLQTDCFNYIKILLRMNTTHLYVCGTYAFSPTCAYIVSLLSSTSRLKSAVIFLYVSEFPDNAGLSPLSLSD